MATLQTPRPPHRRREHIDAGTRPAGPLGIRWGISFRNREGNLPGASGPASPYSEFRVTPPRLLGPPALAPPALS